MATAPYQATVGTAAAQVNGGAPNANLHGIEVKALAANTDKVYVGISGGVTTGDGFELSAGESWLIPPSLAADDGLLFAISGSPSQGVCVAVY